MLRRFAPIAVLLMGAALLVIPSAHAGATRTVEMSISGYSPTTLTVLQGTTVTWHTADFFNHTSTSDQGFWKSPLIPHDGTYSQTDAFLNAGSYPYHCTQHPLHGTVRVPLAFNGSATHGWSLTWSSAPSTPAHRAFDVQIKRPGSQTFVAFKTRTAQLQANFNPAKNGKYQFRARTINTSNGKHSDWSSPVTLTIS